MPKQVDAVTRKHAPYVPNMELPTVIRDNPRVHELLGGGVRLRALEKLHRACDACDATDADVDVGPQRCNPEDDDRAFYGEGGVREATAGSRGKAMLRAQKAAKKASMSKLMGSGLGAGTRTREEMRFDELERAIHDVDTSCNGDNAAASALLKLGMPLGWSTRHGRVRYGPTPLHRICAAGDIARAELLLQKVLELNNEKSARMSPNVREVLAAKDDAASERTPILTALGHGNGELARALLPYGADVTACDTIGRNAIFQAFEFGLDDEIVSALVMDSVIDESHIVSMTEAVRAAAASKADAHGAVVARAVHTPKLSAVALLSATSAAGSTPLLAACRAQDPTGAAAALLKKAQAQYQANLSQARKEAADARAHEAQLEAEEEDRQRAEAAALFAMQEVEKAKAAEAAATKAAAAAILTKAGASSESAAAADAAAAPALAPPQPAAKPPAAAGAEAITGVAESVNPDETSMGEASAGASLVALEEKKQEPPATSPPSPKRARKKTAPISVEFPLYAHDKLVAMLLDDSAASLRARARQRSMPPPLGKDPRYAELLRLFDIGIVHRAELERRARVVGLDPRCFELPRAAPIDRFAVQTPTEAMIADVNRADEAGETPLLVVVRRGSMQLTRMLLVAGAFVEQQDAFGRTPFWRACEAGYDDLVKFLADQVCVRHGGGLGFLVRMDEAAHAGASQPRDVAKENGHKELSEWIRKEAFRRDECMLPLYDAVDRRARPSNLCPRQPALPQKVDQAALAAEARRKQRERDEQARREILGLDSPPKTATPKLPELLPVLGEGAAAQSSSRPSSRHRVSGGRLVEMSEAEAAFRKKRKEESARRAHRRRAAGHRKHGSSSASLAQQQHHRERLRRELEAAADESLSSASQRAETLPDVDGGAGPRPMSAATRDFKGRYGMQVDRWKPPPTPPPQGRPGIYTPGPAPQRNSAGLSVTRPYLQ